MSDGVDITRAVLVLAAVGYLMLGTVAAASAVTAGAGVAYETPSGMIVTANEQHTTDGTNPFSGTDTVEINNMTISSGSSSNITIDQFEGSYTRTSEIDAVGDITINPGDKPQVTVGGSLTSLDFTDMQTDDGVSDFSYAATGSSTLNVTTQIPNAGLLAIASDGEILDSAQTDGAGRVVFELPDGSYSVSLKTTTAPEISNEEPQDGTTINEIETNLSVDITDADFGEFNETVTVEFYGDSGSVVGTDTLTSSGTATTDYTAVPGANEWSVNATDKSGNTVQSGTFSFDAPGELEIRNELSPSELVTNANTTIEFYPQGDLNEVVTREATGGTVDMSALPADQPIVAVVRADGYIQRRVFLRSFVESQTVYLLPTTADAVDIEFELEDYSGRFPSDDTTLIVEKGINGTFETVQGDFFGSTGRFSVTLQRDTRHRLFLRNVETGEEEELGPFTPTISGVQTVRIQQSGEIELSEDIPQILLDPPINSIEASPNANFGVAITEGSETITNWNITVEHVDKNGSKTQLATRTGGGTASESFELNLSGLNGSVQAQVEYETASGSTGLVTLDRGIRGYYPAAEGLLGGVLDIGSGLGVDDGASPTSTMVAFILSVLATVGTAAGTRGSAETTGLAALGSMVFFAIIGWLATEVLFAVTATFGALMLLRQRI